MHIENRGVRKIGSSSFIKTYEPINLPTGANRILLEAHSTRSRETTESFAHRSESVSEGETLATLVLLSPGESQDWAMAPAFLIELESLTDIRLDEDPYDGGTVEVRLRGVPRVMIQSGKRRDQFGNWEWSAHLRDVPFRLIDRSVHGNLRISGRGCQVPRELVEVGLDRYWEGRIKFLDEFEDNPPK